MNKTELNQAAKAFIAVAVWADAPEGTKPRATKEATEAARVFIERFVNRYPLLCSTILATPGYGGHPDTPTACAAFGHDLYLSCRGHGVGFSDREELGEHGARVADIISKNWQEWHIEPHFSHGWMHL